jgi:hypothetical protein
MDTVMDIGVTPKRGIAWLDEKKLAYQNTLPQITKI